MAIAELTDLDRELIQKYVLKIPKGGVYIEIGTKYGGSAEVAINTNPDITADGVDLTDDYLEFEHPRFNFHRVSSIEMAMGWVKPIDVLFIDADHDQAGIDFAAWKHFVKPGGVVIFHDYAHHSLKVIRDCEEIILDPRWELLRRPEKAEHDESSMFIICRK